MRTLHVAGFAAVLAATALVAPGGATAASPETVSGGFDGPVAYVGCTAPDNYATGSWTVTLHGASAKGNFVIDLNGEPHVAYAFPGLKAAPNSTPTEFVVYGRTQAGMLTVTVSDGRVEYKIAPYRYGDLVCSSMTIPGTVDRD